jgi:hypothetical protein
VKDKTSTEQIVLDLLVAMLAVNRWTLEQAAEIANGLKQAGLTEPSAVRRMTLEEISKRLADAGYTRGSFMEALLARRIRDASAVLDDGGLRLISDGERTGEQLGIKSFLLTLNGVGPEVVRNFLILRS